MFRCPTVSDRKSSENSFLFPVVQSTPLCPDKMDQARFQHCGKRIWDAGTDSDGLLKSCEFFAKMRESFALKQYFGVIQRLFPRHHISDRTLYCRTSPSSSCKREVVKPSSSIFIHCHLCCNLSFLFFFNLSKKSSHLLAFIRTLGEVKGTRKNHSRPDRSTDGADGELNRPITSKNAWRRERTYRKFYCIKFSTGPIMLFLFKFKFKMFLI